MYELLEVKENDSRWKRQRELITILAMLFTISMMFLHFLTLTENDVNYDYQSKNFNLVCYYEFPRFKTDLLPENIPNICSHINLGFGHVNCTDNSLSLSTEQLQVISRINILKTKNENLKILLSVGGAGATSFSCMVANHTNRKMFIRSTMKVLKTYKLDGIDLDWEWPVFDGGKKEKVKFQQLLYELRQEFNRHEKKYLLTVAVAAVESIIDTAYYVGHMAEQVDFVNVMTYDYHFFQNFYPLTDYNAPLYPSSLNKNSLLANFNINYSVNYWIAQSMPKEKIVLGMPAYGHTYMLSTALNQGLHAPAKGIGSVGANGYATYPQICDFLNKPGSHKVFDNETKVPYTYNFLDWISFDDELSIKIKTEYVMEHQLGGAMVWSLNNDDYMGSCKTNVPNFPIIRTIHSVFSRYNNQDPN